MYLPSVVKLTNVASFSNTSLNTKAKSARWVWRVDTLNLAGSLFMPKRKWMWKHYYCLYHPGTNGMTAVAIYKKWIPFNSILPPHFSNIYEYVSLSWHERQQSWQNSFSNSHKTWCNLFCKTKYAPCRWNRFVWNTINSAATRENFTKYNKIPQCAPHPVPSTSIRVCKTIAQCCYAAHY